MKPIVGEIITNVESIQFMQKEWTALLEHSGMNNLFLTWEWINSWCINMFDKSTTPQIVTVRENKNLIGIAPLVIVLDENKEKTIQLLGQSYSYHLGFIAQLGCEDEIYNYIWNYLFDNKEFKINKVEFIHFDENVIFESVITRQCKKRGLIIDKAFQNPCKVLQLPFLFDEYIKSGIISKNLRRNIKKDLNRLKLEYSLDFFLADSSTYKHYWSEMLDLHREMMQSRNKGSVLLSDSFPKHLQQVAEVFLAKMDLKLSVLTINHETSAIMLGIIYNGVFNALTIGVNHRLIKKIPWLNLTILSHLFSIKTAIEFNCKYFDFGGGRHDYKYKMGGIDTGGVKFAIYMSSSKEEKEKHWPYFISLANKKVWSIFLSKKYSG
jgi:CelD/BcsL family acetyltransferase involved in cellulose biosynthesis